MTSDRRATGTSYGWRFVAAQVINTAGSAVSLVAIPTYVFEHLGASALGFSTACVTGSRLLAYLPIGHLIDRRSARFVTLFGLLIAAVGAAMVISLPPSILTTAVAASIVSGFGVACTQVGLRAWAPRVLPDGQLRANQGRLSLIATSGATVGPIAAAGLLAILQPAWLVGIDAISFLMAGVVLLGMPAGPAHENSAPPGRQRLSLGALGDIWRSTSQRWMLWGMLQNALQVGLGFAPMYVLIRVYTLSTGGQNLLSAALAASSLASLPALYLSARWRPKRAGTIAAVGAALYALIPLSMLAGTGGALFIAAVVLGSVGINIGGPWWYESLNRNVAPKQLGQINSLDLTSRGLLEPISMAIVAPLVTLVGLPSVTAGITLCLIGVPLLLLLAIPTLRQWPVRTEPQKNLGFSHPAAQG